MLANYEKTFETLLSEEKELIEKRKTQLIELETFSNIDEREKESQEKSKYHDGEVKKKQIEITTIERDVANNTENLGKLTEKLEYKLNIQKDIEKINKVLDFLTPAFSDLMQTIESKIMQKVYATFNFLFKKWFSMLIEDETIAVRLDENFNPKISQNGYDTNVYNLSGGEKTSLALSYRLALTKTINEILVNHTTNSLLILDEPTDGFSEQQLDRMRDVLDELDINQIIIVSHESKIESFVNNIINISKKEHASVVG
jgi:exonuclease SbcC